MFRSLTGEVSAIFPLWFSMTIITGIYFFLPRLASIAEGKAMTGQKVISPSTAPVILLGLIVLGAGAVFFGRLSDKIGRTRTIMIGVAGEIGFLLILPQLFQVLIVVPPDQPFLVTLQQVGILGVVGGILFFLGSALVPTILAYVGDRASHEYRGSAMGLYSLMLSAGIALGTVLAGVADEIGSQGGLNPQAGVEAVFFTGVIIFSTLSVATGILLRQNRHSPIAPPLPTEEARSL
jgi:MFS family permease